MKRFKVGTPVVVKQPSGLQGINMEWEGKVSKIGVGNILVQDTSKDKNFSGMTFWCEPHWLRRKK
jgi:hypothetical protein